MYLLCAKLGRIEIFADYYKRFKLLEKSIKPYKIVYSKEDSARIHDIFFYLLDTEMSLRSGCSNEFLQNTLYMIEQSWVGMELVVLSDLLTRCVLIMMVCSPKAQKFKIPERYLKFIKLYAVISQSKGNTEL